MPKRKSQKRAEPPEFFVDRSLGRHDVVNALRGLGLTVHAMFEIYPHGEGSKPIPDVEWLADCAKNGWVALHKNPEIHRNKFERAVLLDAGVRSFVITRGHLPGSEAAARYVKHINTIIRYARKPGPYAYGVYTDGVRAINLDR